MRDKILRRNLFLGILVLIVAAVLLALKLPFIKIWFYNFAWWGFILAADSINYRRLKTSPLAKPADFFFLAFISVFVWLVFELFNLSLQNWSYHGLPKSLFVRWPGYFVAFATVVPALLEISLFIISFFKGRAPSLFRMKFTSRLLDLSLGAGLLFLATSFIWPRVFFPLVWLGFILIFEPLNYRASRPSFFRDLEDGDWTMILSWLGAGLAAGLLWEFLNFWAGSHWEYSLPHLKFWRIFQMPVFGYFGFLPFAAGVFAFVQVLEALRNRIKRKVLLNGVFVFAFLAFYGFCFYLIDRYTVIK